MYDLIFITTFIDHRCISDLLLSVLNFNSQLKLAVILVNQTEKLLNYKSNAIIHFYEIKSPLVGLSAARNLAINFILNEKLVAKYVMFPDDDTTFDHCFFMNFKNVVNSNTLIDVYCRNTRKMYKQLQLKEGQIVYDINKAMSVNMIIKFDIFQKVGFFDEAMGVGAYYGAGEDTDYFFRCHMNTGNGFYYTRKLWNYHPASAVKYMDLSFKQLQKRYINYSRGVIYFYWKHKKPFGAVVCICKGIVGMCVSLLSGNLKLSIARFYGVLSRMKTMRDLYRGILHSSN